MRLHCAKGSRQSAGPRMDSDLPLTPFVRLGESSNLHAHPGDSERRLQALRVGKVLLVVGDCYCLHAGWYPALYSPMDHSLRCCSIHGILQTRILECVAIPFSRGSSQLKDLPTPSFSFIGWKIEALRAQVTEGRAAKDARSVVELAATCFSSWPFPVPQQLNLNRLGPACGAGAKGPARKEAKWPLRPTHLQVTPAPWLSAVLFGIFFVVVQSLSRIWLFATPWTVAHQASLPFSISWSLLKLMSIESVMPSNHDAIQPSHPLSPPSSCRWVSSLPQVAKVLKLRLQYRSFQWIFRVDFL